MNGHAAGCYLAFIELEWQSLTDNRRDEQRIYVIYEKDTRVTWDIITTLTIRL